MKKMRRRVPDLSRKSLVNPHASPFRVRAKAAGATDLRENFRIEELPRGYSRVRPVDPTRKMDQR